MTRFDSDSAVFEGEDSYFGVKADWGAVNDLNNPDKLDSVDIDNLEEGGLGCIEDNNLVVVGTSTNSYVCLVLASYIQELFNDMENNFRGKYVFRMRPISVKYHTIRLDVYVSLNGSENTNMNRVKQIVGGYNINKTKLSVNGEAKELSSLSIVSDLSLCDRLDIPDDNIIPFLI